jgi:anti-anti-sigma factor
VVVVPPAELDLLTAPQVLSDTQRSLADQPQRLVVNMTSVRFLGSRGIQALLDAREEAVRAGVTFELAGVHGNVGVCRVLAITGVMQIFDITGPEEGYRPVITE